MKRNLIISLTSVFIVLALASCGSFMQTVQPETETQIESEGAELVEAESVEAEEDVQDVDDSALDLPSLEALQSAYEEIYQEVLPSVVSIEVTQTVSLNSSFGFELPDNGEDQEYQESGEGSGFVLDTEGHIVTNYHVVEDADTIRIRFADGTSVLGELIGFDSASDLAVLKVDVDTSILKPIQFADSTEAKVGQIVVAIGNPFRLNSSMTTGIISGLGRSLALDTSTTLTFTIPDIIQTDAAINPGNSGGVLVDIKGQLVGVTTAIESPVQANAGVGYVVPSVIVQKIVPFLIEDGSYKQPYVGVSGTDMIPEIAEAMGLDTDQRGALIITVNPGTPAEDAGLQGSDRITEIDGYETDIGGDVIIAVDGQDITDFEDLTAFLARYANVGQTLEITFLRDGEEMQTSLTLASRPGEEESPFEIQEIMSDAWLGISNIDMTEEIALEMGLDRRQEGVLIQQITAGSPADEAELVGSYKPFEIDGEEVLIGGDVIIGVDDIIITRSDDLMRAIGFYEPEDEVTLTILRDGNEINVKLNLGERP